METNNLPTTTEPKIFLRSAHGLLELQSHEEPLDKRPTKHERLDLEAKKGYRIHPVKFNNKFYIYRVR